MENALVIDNGTGMVKAGFASEAKPRVVFPSIVAYPKHAAATGAVNKDFYIGEEIQQKRSVCVLKYPVEHGIVRNWDDMIKIWQHTFNNELGVDPREKNVLLTEPPLNPLRNRQKMGEIMFEQFSTGGIWVGIQAVLSLYASGRTSGLVLDCGDGVSHTVPVYEGYAISEAVRRIDLAGRDLTTHLANLLYETGHNMESSAEREIVRDIKEQLCYVAEDYQQELDAVEKQKKNVEKSYELPDGGVINVGSQRFRCTEPLFQPGLLGKDQEGIHNMVSRTIKDCPLDLRSVFYGSIVLSGGTTMFDGMVQRLEKELKALAPAKASVKVVAPEERQYSVYIGASVLASLESFKQMWVTKQEWEDEGDRKSVV